MNNTPLGNRIHIGLFGKRNAGKSSLINAITNQKIALVSEVAGTTTDPVYKTMELLPLGPVVIIDTAGIDDVGELGKLRVEKSYEVLRKTDYAILVVNSNEGITDSEVNFLKKLKSREVNGIIVFNKNDELLLSEEEINRIEKELEIKAVSVSSLTGNGIENLKKIISENAKPKTEEPSLVSDLILPGDIVVLVTPIDKAAPKGRLILPQQQVIRDVIESDAIAMITKEHELKMTLASLTKKPKIVITDSQAFLKVDGDTPSDVMMTSFSILISRQKGELLELVKGLKQIKNLKDSDYVLVVEGCTHHRQSDDIGKVKIPRWIRQICGQDINFEYASGTYFPQDIEKYKVIIHCGGCMLNKQEMMYRIKTSVEKGVSITNYGMLIGMVQGVVKRALKPFPLAYMELEG